MLSEPFWQYTSHWMIFNCYWHIQVSFVPRPETGRASSSHLSPLQGTPSVFGVSSIQEQEPGSSTSSRPCSEPMPRDLSILTLLLPVQHSWFQSCSNSLSMLPGCFVLIEKWWSWVKSHSYCKTSACMLLLVYPLLGSTSISLSSRNTESKCDL